MMLSFRCPTSVSDSSIEAEFHYKTAIYLCFVPNQKDYIKILEVSDIEIVFHLYFSEI
jgi:hypothetical protein